MKSLDSKLQKIVDAYFKDLKSFIKNNRLDSDYIKDIEERVFDKIEAKNPQTPSDIKNILEEIGSPEEIFKEEIENSENIKIPKNSFLQKIMNTGNKVIFLGVLKELGDKTGINANVYRVLFLVLTFLWILTGANITALLFVAYFLGFLILRTGIFRFFFSIGILLILLVILFISIMIFGAYLWDFSVGNMYPFMDFSPFFPAWMAIGIFSLIVLIIVFFRYGFFAKFSLRMFTTGLVCAIIAITFWGAVGFDLFGKYNQQNEIKKELSIDLEGRKEISFNEYTYSITQTPRFFDAKFINFHVLPQDFSKSPDDKIHIKYSIEFYGNHEIAEKAKQFIKWVKFTILPNNEVEFRLETDTKEKYPLIPIDVDIKEILIPENIKFSTDFSRQGNENIEIDEKYKILKKYDFFCKDFIFEEKSEKPKCLLDDDKFQTTIDWVKFDILRENPRQYIPLKFAKSSYSWDAVWKFTPKGNDVYSFEVSDGPTKFFLEAKIIENTEIQRIEVKEVKIVDYEGEITKRWYKNPEILNEIKK